MCSTYSPTSVKLKRSEDTRNRRSVGHVSRITLRVSSSKGVKILAISRSLGYILHLEGEVKIRPISNTIFEYRAIPSVDKCPRDSPVAPR